MPVRTVIERGPKDKRSVAFSIDWPGWSRGARTAELALQTLESYRERYRSVARLAGMLREFDAAGTLEIVEDKLGTGSVDFSGMSFAPSAAEQEPMDEASLQRESTLLRACWAFFDDVAARVSPEMRKARAGEDETETKSSATPSAPRVRTSRSGSGSGSPKKGALTPAGLHQHREAYLAAMRAYNAGRISRRMRSWTLPYLIRHSADHMLDHAWEMEDKDLSAQAGA